MVSQQRPQAPALPPVSSKAKDYSSERPSEVQNELDELRNRGLAKVLNRHFTDTTKKLAKEKAAADAALADLERRRANTSEFVPSKGGELHPFDTLYVELQQKRAECRRKEKETMLLYQRYVHKYGKTAKQTSIATPTNAAAAAAKEEHSPATSTVTTPDAPPPPSPLPPRTALQPLDENVEEDGGGTSFHFPAFLRSKQVHHSKTHEDPPTEPVEDTNTEEEPQETKRPEAEPTSGGSFNDPPEEDDEQHNKNVEPTPRKLDPPADPPAVKFAQELATPMMENISTVGEKLLGHGRALFAGHDDDDEEESDESEQSEAAAGEMLTPVETTIKKASDRMEILSDTSDTNRPTLEVTASVQATTSLFNEDDVDDRSIISGLTINSHVTKQVMEEIEQEMNHFLNTETRAIQKLLDEEEEDATNGSITLNGSIIGDEMMHASMKAEAMAKEMQKILDEYAKEELSTAEETTQTASETVATTAGYPRKYETSDPTKHWMVYYDEKFQREYYFEKNNNVTQWEPPDGSISQVDPRMLTEGMSPALKRSVSRRDLYRRKMRKRRMRRLVAFSFVALCVGGTVFYWQNEHSEKTYPEAMVLGWNHAGQVVGDLVDTSLYAIADTTELLKERIEYTLTDRKEREEAEASKMDQAEKAQLARQQAEHERLRQEAEKMAEQEMARKLQEQREREEAEAERKREEAKKRQQERLLELERQREREVVAKRQRELQTKRERGIQLQREKEQEEKEAQIRAEEEARRAAKIAAENKAEEGRKALQRPFWCNIPLAYIHPRCFRLAKLNPIYKETDVLHSFLQ